MIRRIFFLVAGSTVAMILNWVYWISSAVKVAGWRRRDGSTECKVGVRSSFGGLRDAANGRWDDSYCKPTDKGQQASCKR